MRTPSPDSWCSNHLGTFHSRARVFFFTARRRSPLFWTRLTPARDTLSAPGMDEMKKMLAGIDDTDQPFQNWTHSLFSIYLTALAPSQYTQLVPPVRSLPLPFPSLKRAGSHKPTSTSTSDKTKTKNAAPNASSPHPHLLRCTPSRRTAPGWWSGFRSSTSPTSSSSSRIPKRDHHQQHRATNCDGAPQTRSHCRGQHTQFFHQRQYLGGRNNRRRQSPSPSPLPAHRDDDVPRATNEEGKGEDA
jgi:hypothetical protein